MTKKYDIEIEQGETFVVGFRKRNSTANTNSFAGATSAKAQIRESPESSKVAAELDCSFTADNETLWVRLEAEDSQAMKIRTGVWDLKVTWPDKVDYIAAGKVKVIPRVTR